MCLFVCSGGQPLTNAELQELVVQVGMKERHRRRIWRLWENSKASDEEVRRMILSYDPDAPNQGMFGEEGEDDEDDEEDQQGEEAEQVEEKKAGAAPGTRKPLSAAQLAAIAAKDEARRKAAQAMQETQNQGNDEDEEQDEEDDEEEYEDEELDEDYKALLASMTKAPAPSSASKTRGPAPKPLATAAVSSEMSQLSVKEEKPE